MNKKIIIIFIVILLALGYFILSRDAAQVVSNKQLDDQQVKVFTNEPLAEIAQTTEIFEPISQAKSRVSKKPFGLKVSPDNSPVHPERFTGYHTGVDFETTELEQNTELAVYAICEGPLILKRAASGYGGVVVQSCQIDKQSVTIVYGHLRLSSITAKLDQRLLAGEQIGLLGTAYTDETSGERKHLHLAIHRGSSINILGYVANADQLQAWLDPMTLLP